MNRQDSLAFLARTWRAQGVRLGQLQDGVLPAALPSLTEHPLPEFYGDPPEITLQTRVAEGGMGEIWLAQQRSLMRGVAAKRPRAGAPAEARTRLLWEARVAGALQPSEHPPGVCVGDGRGW